MCGTSYVAAMFSPVSGVQRPRGKTPAAALRDGGRCGGRGRRAEDRERGQGCRRLQSHSWKRRWRCGGGGRRRKLGVEPGSGAWVGRRRVVGCGESSLLLSACFSLLRGREPAARQGEGRDACLFRVAVFKTMHGGLCLAAFGAFLHRAYRNQAQASTLQSRSGSKSKLGSFF